MDIQWGVGGEMYQWMYGVLLYVRDEALPWLYHSPILRAVMYLVLAYDGISHLPQIRRNLVAEPEALVEALAISQVMFNCGLGFFLILVFAPVYADPMLLLSGVLLAGIYGLSWVIWSVRTRSVRRAK